VLLFSTNPGRIAGELKIDIPRPRDRTDPRFEDYVDRIYVEMTARQRTQRSDRGGGGLGLLMTHVSPNLVSGLIEALAATPYNGKADLPDIASDLQMEIDELFPVAEALQILRLGELEGGDLKLSHMGKRFADGEMNERKEIFSRALMSQVPLAAHIRRVLDERASHTAPKRRFLDELEDHMTEDAANETLRTVVSWARFGELFSYDDESETFSLENPS